MSAPTTTTTAMNWVFDRARTRSIKRHARGIHPPVDLSDTNLVQRGFREYDEMCVQCHGAPGIDPGEIAKGLWPKAPNLGITVPDWTSGELYWITRNGIKLDRK